MSGSNSNQYMRKWLTPKIQAHIETLEKCSAESYYKIAMAYYSHGRKLAYKKDKDTVSALEDVLNFFNKAIICLKEAIKIQPNNEHYQENLKLVRNLFSKYFISENSEWTPVEHLSLELTKYIKKKRIKDPEKRRRQVWEIVPISNEYTFSFGLYLKNAILFHESKYGKISTKREQAIDNLKNLVNSKPDPEVAIGNNEVYVLNKAADYLEEIIKKQPNNEQYLEDFEQARSVFCMFLVNTDKKFSLKELSSDEKKYIEGNCIKDAEKRRSQKWKNMTIEEQKKAVAAAYFEEAMLYYKHGKEYISHYEAGRSIIKRAIHLLERAIDCFEKAIKGLPDYTGPINSPFIDEEYEKKLILAKWKRDEYKKFLEKSNID